MKTLWSNLKKHYVYIPILYSIVSVALAVAVSIVDTMPLHQWLPGVILTRVDLGRNILSAIATSLLTMSTITFSVMTMAMNTYSSQYSSRTLPNLYSDLVTVRTKALFLGGFLYSILSLLLMKDKLQENAVFSPALAVLISVCIVSYFLYFIQYVSRMTQVNELLVRLSGSAVDNILNTEQCGAVVQHGRPMTEGNGHPVSAPSTGYIQRIDRRKLLKLTNKYNVLIEIVPNVGEFVTGSSPYLRIWGWKPVPQRSKEKLLVKLQDIVTIGKTRSNQDDIMYMIQEIVEIALRAISPSINDPNTAIYCIRELGQILTRYGNGYTGVVTYKDPSGIPRFIIHMRSFEYLLYKTFYQVTHYARSDVSVMGELMETLGHIAAMGTKDMREQVGRFAKQVEASIDHSVLTELDRAYWESKRAYAERMTVMKQ